MSQPLDLGKIPLPDLRFEQSFMRQLRGYANQSSKASSPGHLDKLSSSEVELLSKDIDQEEQSQLHDHQPTPLPVITPGIVTYAIIKDQIIMPLLQGFLYSGILILLRPAINVIINNGLRFGTGLANFIGINQVLHRPL